MDEIITYLDNNEGATFEEFANATTNNSRILSRRNLAHSHEANLFIINRLKDIFINHGIILSLDLNHIHINNNNFELIFGYLNSLVNNIPKDKLEYLLNLENIKIMIILKKL